MFFKNYLDLHILLETTDNVMNTGVELSISVQIKGEMDTVLVYFVLSLIEILFSRNECYQLYT